MGNSTTALNDLYDSIAASGVFDPRNAPSGYEDNLALSLGNDVMSDLITERFNWKFNRALAAPFYTNSWQQDYPQPAQKGGPIGWGEICYQTDINSTAIPLPLWPMSWLRDLPRLSTNQSPAAPGDWKISWDYNSNLNLGTWPGAFKTFTPLVTTGQISQNPIMNMLDSSGNILIVTTFGTTGASAPSLPANSAEGATVTDGSVVWTCVSPNSQGFRLWPLPNSTGPVYQISPAYQLDAPLLTTLQSLINPFPDSYQRHFRRALELQCKMHSPNPKEKEDGAKEYPLFLSSLVSAKVQGDKEQNSYALVPATYPVDSGRNGGRVLTANNPYGW